MLAESPLSQLEHDDFSGIHNLPKIEGHSSVTDHASEQRVLVEARQFRVDVWSHVFEPVLRGCNSLRFFYCVSGFFLPQLRAQILAERRASEQHWKFKQSWSERLRHLRAKKKS